jgi:hypothetical protein
MKLLLFIAVIITYGIYLSYMPVLFRIKIFNIFKYGGRKRIWTNLSLKRWRRKIRTLSATFVVSPGIQLGGANLGREKVLHLNAKKGTWWLTPPQGMHLMPLWQVHQMTGGWIPVLLFIFVLIDPSSLHSRDSAAHQS